MFEALPDRDRDGGWTSSDAVTESDVRTAITDAIKRNAQAQNLYDRAVKSSTDSMLAHSYAALVTEAEGRAARLARVQAILLTAMHLEGVINAWGVIAVGEVFFKQHIERCAIETKVALLLALDGQGLIPADHESLRRVRRLFERRNQLVHRKTKEMRAPLDSTDFGGPSPESDFELCTEALDAFQALLLAASPRAGFLAAGYRGENAP